MVYAPVVGESRIHSDFIKTSNIHFWAKEVGNILVQRLFGDFIDCTSML